MNTNYEDPLPLGHERMRCELNVHPESIHSLVTSQSLRISFLRASTERNRQADCFKILRWLPVNVCYAVTWFSSSSTFYQFPLY
uniref:Uncharacterized protein n=1 Tax=Glossina palpalis gambiensis TaxID=67801 RepID=A0A1B0BK56_9MUSC